MTLREQMEQEDERAFVERQRAMAAEIDRNSARARLSKIERRLADATHTRDCERRAKAILDAAIDGTTDVDRRRELRDALRTLDAGAEIIGNRNVTNTSSTLVTALTEAGLAPLVGTYDPLVGRPSLRRSEALVAELELEVAALRARAGL